MLSSLTPVMFPEAFAFVRVFRKTTGPRVPRFLAYAAAATNKKWPAPKWKLHQKLPFSQFREVNFEVSVDTFAHHPVHRRFQIQPLAAPAKVLLAYIQILCHCWSEAACWAQPKAIPYHGKGT